MLQYNVNQCVFNGRMKSLLGAGPRELSGNEFRTDGPAAEKAHWVKCAEAASLNNHKSSSTESKMLP